LLDYVFWKTLFAAGAELGAMQKLYFRTVVSGWQGCPFAETMPALSRQLA
jgi:hypothetical protein